VVFEGEIRVFFHSCLLLLVMTRLAWELRLSNLTMRDGSCTIQIPRETSFSSINKHFEIAGCLCFYEYPRYPATVLRSG